MALTVRQRTRRLALLTCHAVRNLIYYRAGWGAQGLVRYGEFWKTANSNFLDTCVTEWCKVFADFKGAHHWRKVIPEDAAFVADLLADLNLTEEEFAAYIQQMRTYRDKFVAHLDEELVMHIPAMDVAMASLQFLYARLQGVPALADHLAGLPGNMTAYRDQCAAEAHAVYAI